MQEHLEALEKERKVRILYACESGSRAWGFASQDSDYDVRFLYVHPAEHYLSFRIEQKRDVIEVPLEGDLDLNGWDLRKALQLLVKSNGALVEWLTSPIVYRDGLYGLRQRLPELVSPRALGFHYFRMARSAVADLADQQASLKRCFYALRPLLAARWLELRPGLPPVALADLRAVLPDELQPTVDVLLKIKLASAEKDRQQLDPGLLEFLRAESDRLGGVVAHLPVVVPDLELLDGFFREALG